MNVLIVLDYKFMRSPEGAVWTAVGQAYSFWARYLEVFDAVRVVARLVDVPVADPRWLRADGPSVTFVAVPPYHGPMEYALRRGEIRNAVVRSFSAADAVVLRVGSVLADAVLPRLMKEGHPYAVEVIGDPWDTFSPGAMKHPLRAFFRRWFAHRLRAQCSGASAAAYVTEEALQRRYPAAPGSLMAGFSDVELPPEAFVAEPRPIRVGRECTAIITVGTLEQLYKSQDVLIDAVGQEVRDGQDLRLVFVGDGQYRTALEERARKQGLGGRVKFLGWLPSGKTVRAELDAAGLFGLPSRQEGLPRAMVEAMARGLPCLGSTVGGIPELLPAEDMVPPGDARKLAQKIREMVTDPGRMAMMSARNLEKAKGYREDALAGRRRAFFRHVREMTEAALSSRAGSTLPQDPRTAVPGEFTRSTNSGKIERPKPRATSKA
jgi:glycosyltransferase involved in cell wall biosynthesis